jgi:hypothetical protein
MTRQSNVRRFATWIAPLALWAPARLVGAQDVSAPSRAADVGPWLVGAGFEVLQTIANATDRLPLQAGTAVQVGYERSLGTSRFGVRLGASYTHRPDDGGSGKDAAGVALAGIYTLAAGRVRPYLLAGIGADRTEEEIQGAASAGAGTLVRAGRAWLFAEARLVAYPTFGRPGSGDPRDLLPVTVGLRF